MADAYRLMVLDNVPADHEIKEIELTVRDRGKTGQAKFHAKFHAGTAAPKS